MHKILITKQKEIVFYFGQHRRNVPPMETESPERREAALLGIIDKCVRYACECVCAACVSKLYFNMG